MKFRAQQARSGKANTPKRFNVTLTKGTGASSPVKLLEALSWTCGHVPEGFTVPSKAQTASTSWKGRRSGTNTPKRFNVTLTKGAGSSRPVKLLGSLVVDLRKRSETGKQHPAEGFTGPSKPQTAVSNLTIWTGEKWSFKPSKHVLERERKWHQHAK